MPKFTVIRGSGGGNDDGPPPPEDGDPGAWGGDTKPPVSEPADNSWRDGLIVTNKGSPKLTFGNVLHTLRHHPALSGRIAYDSRRLHPVWTEPPPWCSECRALEDKDAGELAYWLQLDMSVGYSAKLCAEALLTESHQRPIDRVSDYLKSLTWDGRPRLDTWVSDCLGADQSAYIEAIGRAWCISAVARALQPGCKADSMLVLEGAQGVGKSSALRMLAGEDLFAELAIDVSDKDSWLAIHGPWIVEWSELAGFGRRESEAVKSFLSRQIDRMRPPYGRATGDFPRKVIFTGSTNESTYLGDPTGGRRYWPVLVRSVDLAGLESSRDQIWAEAVHAYHSGEPWWLDGRDESIAATEQDQRIEADPWESLVIEMLGDVRFIESDEVTAVEIVIELGIAKGSITAPHTRRVSRILDRLGWTRKRGDAGENGRTPLVFSRPERDWS